MPELPLPLIGHELVRLDGWTQWVQVTHFAIPDQGDAALLRALVQSPGYQHDYASPFDGGQDAGIHGPWRLSAVRPDLFAPTEPEACDAVLRRWAAGWYAENPDADLLARVRELLRTGRVYALANPGDEHRHDYGAVVGAGGFHEFVVIDAARERLSVVVASDD